VINKVKAAAAAVDGMVVAAAQVQARAIRPQVVAAPLIGQATFLMPLVSPVRLAARATFVLEEQTLPNGDKTQVQVAGPASAGSVNLVSFILWLQAFSPMAPPRPLNLRH
jgi:hypothetical protein